MTGARLSALFLFLLVLLFIVEAKDKKVGKTLYVCA